MLVLLLGLSYWPSIPPTMGALGVNISSPQLDEHIPGGSTYTLRWSVDDVLPPGSYYEIGYIPADNSAAGEYIAKGLPASTTSFNWHVPSVSPQYYTLMIAVIASDETYTDGRVNFYIDSGGTPPTPTTSAPPTAPSLTVLSPNGGEAWSAAESRQISWQVTGDTSKISTFRISLSKDGGSTYSELSGASSSARAFTILVPPGIESTQCRIRVQALDGSGSVLAVDTSDRNFTIKGYNFGPIQDKVTLFIRARGSSVMPGRQITYKILISNHSSESISGLYIQDPLPPQVTFVSADNGGYLLGGDAFMFEGEPGYPMTGNAVQWNLGSLETSAYRLLTLVVRAKPDITTGTWINNICQAGAESYSPFASNTVSVFSGPVEHQKYIDGYPDGTFRPNQSITRAELAKIICMVYGLGWNQGQRFDDVVPSDWFFGYVNAATEQGYLEGFPDGNYYPDEYATQDQVGVIATRFSNIPEFSLPATAAIFGSLSPDSWAYNPITAAALLGVLSNASGTYGTGEFVSRWQAVESFCKGANRGPLLLGSIVQHLTDYGNASDCYGWVEESAARHIGVWDDESEKEKLIQYLGS
ncbi:MAG: S-layer homology domain-containing protein [bacterium]